MTPESKLLHHCFSKTLHEELRRVLEPEHFSIYLRMVKSLYNKQTREFRQEIEAQINKSQITENNSPEKAVTRLNLS